METQEIQRTQVSIEEQMRDAYLEYAMSVIVGRALPDVRDGMKPVHRRILYAMYDMGNTHDKAYKKSARIVGDVIGKYHPHGDTAVYDTMVRMAQDFSMRYTLIDGQGNFGSVDGDSPAAMRYTEVRLRKITDQVLADLEKETVSFNPNYDNSLSEPSVLPTKIPNLLVNGSSGIAVGMATNIPPHNLGEIIDGIRAIVANPSISISELMELIPGPDFPTAGLIYGRNGIKEAYHTGKGTLYLRARAEVEQSKADRERIVVTELPYQVNKSKFIEHVALLVREKKIEGISDIRDESDRSGMRVVFDLKKGEDSRVLLNHLYKNTQMEISFGITMLALDHQQPKMLNLKECLVAFLQHRKVVVTKRTIFDLKKAEEKAHILEGLKKAVENLDEVVALIRKAANPGEAQEQLIAKFQFSEIQAKAILEMRLQRLTGLEREKIISDYNETMRVIAELKSILADEKKVLAIIDKELDEVKKAFSDPRRSEFVEEPEEMEDEDFVVEEETVVTVTFTGYVKRLPLEAYRSQKRGGKGAFAAPTKAEDFVQDIFVASTHESLLCFTDQGRMYWLKVYKIPESAKNSKGKPIVNLLNLTTNERIQAVLTVKEFKEDQYVVLVTKKGIIKKTSLGSFARPIKKGVIVIHNEEGDSVIDAKLSTGNNQIVLVSKFGLSIRFDEHSVRPMGRTARGVVGMRLDPEDMVIGMAIVDPSDTKTQVLTVTQKGYGKRTLIEEYRIQGRGGHGVITMRIIDKNGPVVAVRQVKDEDELIIASDRGNVIRTRVAEISEVGRVAQGVRVINMDEGDVVAAVAKVVEKEDDHETKLGDSGNEALTPTSVPEPSAITPTSPSQPNGGSREGDDS